MNRRILKKKSKQALAILERHYAGQISGDVFLAKRDENFHGIAVEECRRDRWQNHIHPLKGTPMVGACTGYYEPEWKEQTALEELWDLIILGERPRSMSDAEWRRTLRIAKVKPFDQEEFDAWARSCLANDRRESGDEGAWSDDDREAA
jgi:hypothetical protein